MATTHCIVMTTFSSAEQAEPVVREIVSGRWAACAQVGEIRSTYVWDGELRQESEVLVRFKTRADLFPALQARLEELHPYDTPEIVMVPILAGSDGYLSWIDDRTG